MEWITEPEAWVALGTLTALEVVLGIDNLVFLSILTGRLPEERRRAARRTGLMLAMLMRIALLFGLSFVMRLTKPLFELLGQEISGKDIILLAGGLFLIGKATVEIHHALEGATQTKKAKQASSFAAVLVQIALIDIIFSLDSVITAVGMARHLAVMIIAVVISIIIMVLFVNAICDFVERHPTFKMLALSFLILIGLALVGDGLDLHIPKGYLYFAMSFSLGVELLNMRLRRPTDAPMRLRGPHLDPQESGAI